MRAMVIASSAVLVTGGLAMAAQRPAANSSVPPLVLGMAFGSPGFTENFNPFSPNTLDGVDYMYEPLYMVNQLNGKQSPWLATSYRWASSTDLQFTIRKGVKWSNGTPFTPADVVFTFNLLKRFPGLDLNGVWTDMKSVTASGDVVTFKFSTPNIPDWYYIATTFIVNQQQWSKVSNPVKFTNPHPVVTGPYVLKNFNSQLFTLTENPLYWQKSKVHVPEIESVALTSNTTADLQLAQGKFDEASLFTPDIQKVYVDANPKVNHYWYPQGVPVSIFMNLTEYPFNQLKFREAVAYAVNRKTISTNGEYGYMLPANQSQLPPTMQAQWLDTSLQSKYAYNYDPARAESLLKSMGLKKNNQGQLIGPNGKQLRVTIEVPTGYTDYIQDCAIIQKSLESLGISVQVLTPSVAAWTSDTESGHFEMALDRETTYSNPYLDYAELLSKQDSAPVGQIASTNFERWHSAKTNQLLHEYQVTSNLATQKKIVDQIQQILYTQLPVVSLVWGTSFNEYQTNHYVGWPTPKDEYALPPYYYPDTLSIVLHLRPKS